MAYALDTALSGRSEDAMWAAYCACEALEKYITERFAVDDASIDSVPIMQAELSRQQTELMELRAASKTPGNEVAVVARIKRRAESDCELILRLVVQGPPGCLVLCHDVRRAVHLNV